MTASGDGSKKASEFVTVSVAIEMVVTRAAKGELRAAYQKAEDAYRLFARIQAESLTGTLWHNVTCLQSPFFLDFDTNERPRFVFNIQIEKELSA